MKRKKIFYNLIGIPIMTIMMLFAFSSKSEASIADFVGMIDTPSNSITEQADIMRWSN